VAPKVVNAMTRLVACPVHQGSKSSNACINAWFAATPNSTPTQLLAAPDTDKVRNGKRIAYQLPETANNPCGRSFEDAYMLANPKLFPMSATLPNEMELEAWEEAKEVKKIRVRAQTGSH
jgi:putative ATP-dependent endonuclease of OLD family